MMRARLQMREGAGGWDNGCVRSNTALHRACTHRFRCSSLRIMQVETGGTAA